MATRERELDNSLVRGLWHKDFILIYLHDQSWVIVEVVFYHCIHMNGSLYRCRTMTNRNHMNFLFFQWITVVSWSTDQLKTTRAV